jgi:DNA-binding MarR family transcriptional regulator
VAFEREYPAARWLACRAFRELEVVGARIEALVAGIARGHGLSHAALNALAVIEGNGGPLPAGEVGKRMHITSGTITTVLDTLERKGYVRRLTDPSDRRRVLVDVTPAAAAVLDAALPQVQQAATIVMGTLDDDALNSLLDGVTVVREGMAALPDDLPPPPARRKPPQLRRR